MFQVQHQMAQAIYVQTMLAMQAAGINETNNVFTHGMLFIMCTHVNYNTNISILIF